MTTAAIDTSKIFKNHLFLLKIVEVIPLRKSATWSTLYTCTACLIRLISLSLVLAFCVEIRKSENLQQFCEIFFLASTQIKSFLSAMFIQYKHAEIQQLIKKLKLLDNFITASDEMRVLKKYLKNIQYWFQLFVTIFFCILIYCEIMIFSASQPVLPLKLWLPWDWRQGGWRFTLAHFSIFSAMLISAILEILGDTFPQAAMCILCGHLRAISLRLEKIKCRAAQEQHLAYAELVNCIKAHQLLMQAFSIVKKILTIPAGMQFGNSAVAQCSLATYMVYVGVKSDIAILLFLMFVALTFMSFVLCVYGELLEQESMQFSYAVYECNWPNQNVQFRKTLLQLLRQSQKTLQIKAANFFPLNMQTFYKLMKINYSIFAMLNRIK